MSDRDASEARDRRHARRGWLLALAAVGGLSTGARLAHHRCVEVPGRAGWVTCDPDSHHLMHRVEGIAREGFPPAERDPGLSYPEGSAIPGAPYYPALVAAALLPFAPDDAEERHLWLEPRMASLALLFGVATSLVVAWIGRVLAGNRGAWIAGGIHALAPAAIGFANLGNGDYHAFVGLFVALSLGAFVSALKGGAIESGRRALHHGLAVGAPLGLALGAWPAALIDVVVAEASLGVLLVLTLRRELRGLARFGLAANLGALAVALPAILASPWQAERPWIVVCLSRFHAAFLVLAALALVPLLVLRPGSAAARAYPALLAAALVAAAVWIAHGDAALASSLREGFAWASRGEEFIAGVRESLPLFGPRAPFSPWLYLGAACAAAALAWPAALARLVRRGELALLPLVVAAPVAFALAAAQVRFAGAFVVPMALLVAAAGGPALQRLRSTSALAANVVALALPLALEWGGASSTVRYAARGDSIPRDSPVRRGARECAEWLRHAHPDERDRSVLAFWSFGHTLQWAAGKPVVASNYGTYVGVEGFRDPARAFLAPSLDAATPLLDARRVRWILATSDLADHFEPMCAMVEAGGTPLPRLADSPSRHDGSLWYRGLGQRLLLGGRLPSELAPDDRPLQRARLVFVSSLRDRRRARVRGEPAPAAFLWERVAGCRLAARGNAGEQVEIALEIEFPEAGWRVEWRDRAALDAAGRAELVVPYATLDPNGAGRALPGASWSIGSRSGALAISGADVESGATRGLP